METKEKAYEVIYDNNEKILSYLELDPSTLSKTWSEKHKEYVWTQYGKILFNTEIIKTFK